MKLVPTVEVVAKVIYPRAVTGYACCFVLHIGVDNETFEYEYTQYCQQRKEQRDWERHRLP